MSLGSSSWSVKTGGGQVRATSQQVARSVAHLDVSPLLPANTVLKVSNDTGSILSALDYCPLAELAAFTGRSGLSKYVVALNPSQPGGFGAATTHVGAGTGTVTPSAAPHKTLTILCSTGGALGTAAFQFSFDGGVTYTAPVTSVAGATWVYQGVVGLLFTAITFATATYVVNKTCTIGTDGTVTNGSGWVGVVTQASSPLDYYEPLVTILKGGALGTAVISVSMDNGNTTEISSLLTPSGGVVTIPNTGVVLTLAGTFVKGDTYSMLAAPPSGNTSDVTAAMTALRTTPTVAVTLVHLSIMPGAAAGAFSAASTLETAIETAASTNGFDWQGICDCPAPKGGTRFSSALTGRKQQRGASWFWVDAYVDTDPRMELAAKAPQGDRQQGSMRAFLPAGSTSIAGLGDIIVTAGTASRDTADTDSVILAARGVDQNRVAVCVSGRDEYLNPGLDDAQINTFRTYNGPLAVYGSITSGAAGFKMLSTNSSYIYGAGVRCLDVLMYALRPLAQDQLGQTYAVNADGTIASSVKKFLDTKFDTAAKLALGMIAGGDFSEPQASFVSAQVLASSQLGNAPKRLDIAYQLQPKGVVTDVSNTILFSGTLSISQ